MLAQVQGPVAVSVVGLLGELLGQDGVEEHAEGALELRWLHGCGQQQEPAFEPGKLRKGRGGELDELAVQGLQHGVVVSHPAADLPDQLADAVDQHPLDHLLRRLAVDAAVRAVDVRTQSGQCLIDRHPAVQGQPAGGEPRGDLRHPVQPAGQCHLRARHGRLLLRDPGAGGRGAVVVVQLRSFDVCDLAQRERPNAVRPRPTPAARTS